MKSNYPKYLSYQSETQVHKGSRTQYRTYSDEQGRDWLVLSEVDVEGAGTYKCNYKYPDKQIFSMQFDVNVSLEDFILAHFPLKTESKTTKMTKYSNKFVVYKGNVQHITV